MHNFYLFWTLFIKSLIKWKPKKYIYWACKQLESRCFQEVKFLLLIRCCVVIQTFLELIFEQPRRPQSAAYTFKQFGMHVHKVGILSLATAKLSLLSPQLPPLSSSASTSAG